MSFREKVRPTEEVRVYVLDGITHVPHYTHIGEYVCPGYGRHHFKTLTAAMLMVLGAKQEYRFLWPRI